MRRRGESDPTVTTSIGRYAAENPTKLGSKV